MGSEDRVNRINNFNFLSLLGFSLVFISLFALSTGVNFKNRLKDMSPNSEQTLGAVSENTPIVENILPKYVGSENINLNSRSALAIDMETGAVLYEKNSTDPILPASTSKVITALVALDAYDLDQTVIVPKITVEGQKIGLNEGEIIAVEDLLYALLVPSANDAAEVLASNYPGGRDLFVAAMNLKAQSLGLKNSFFVNPTGLDEDGQTTTAQDMVKASFYAMQNPVFEKIVATKKYNIVGENGEVTHRLNNINQLLGEVDGVKGVKTGKTDGAMENLITYIERGDTRVLTAVLGSNDRFGETTNLINWIFKSYDWGK